MINRKALFADETEYFKTPYQPEKGDRVTLRLRTLANDVDEALVVINGAPHRMKKYRSQENFDYYEYSFVCPKKQVNYYFRVSDWDDVAYLNRFGCVENHTPEYDFSFVPGAKVPVWARGAVFYQIYCDRFCNGDTSNDVTDNEYFYTGGHSRKICDWNKTPDGLDVNNFYGGDLQGVMQKIDYLCGLGVEAIYFNPLFVSPSNHKYDTQDYDHIDPHLAVIEDDTEHAMQHWEKHNGYAPKYITRTTSVKNLEKSNEYFIELVKKLHERGIRVVVDGVFNHCGSFNKWLDREGIYLNREGYNLGAYQSVYSPYRNYFRFKNKKVANSEYEGWWGYETLPKLNYEGSEELENYVISTGGKWVSAPFNVDGWRLDVAADLGHSSRYNHAFWKKFREKVRECNPEALVLAEHYGSAESWLVGGEWDTVMNYDAFMEPVTWFLTGMEKHSDCYDGGRHRDGKQFFDSMLKNMARFPRPALDSALNQLSNHDHSRFLTRTNSTAGSLKTRSPEEAAYGIDYRVMALGVMIQMTWPGSPGIYYGDEAGQVGWTDPDSRRTYPWGNENYELLEYHKAAIALRKQIHCLKAGSLKPLDAGNGFIIYGRFDEVDCCAVIINCNDCEISLTVPVWELGLPRDCVKMERMLCTTDQTFCTDREEIAVNRGRILVTLPPVSGCVYRYVFKEE